VLRSQHDAYVTLPRFGAHPGNLRMLTYVPPKPGKPPNLVWLCMVARNRGAIDTLVKYVAVALGPRGIRVNAVAPGVIDTDMSNLVKTDEGKSVVLGMQALKRIGQPDDVGSVVAFLASQDARWITGDTIHVDGGSQKRTLVFCCSILHRHMRTIT
jgi:Enoyl-(Acyl carrier protein) reductase